ncbi:MAG: UDP-N-acetylmuramate--alanine ligase [Rhodospirillaceae bacterium]|nr:UDP-N-acetylmuramate--alanine ligase [Rhodospirillaceae bacterium]
MTQKTSGPRSYFLCGIGGSGMLPLALILQAQGHRVEGSDRTLDATPSGEQAAAKFDYLHRRGIRLHPQDGSGIRRAGQILVASAAVEDSVPDVAAAKRIGARRMSRPGVLAELFNAVPQRIGVAGTSGKSTVTGMIAWILHCAGRGPTVVNGAVMKNFAGPDDPFASALAGSGDTVVSEIDESDGSIALFDPTVAVLTNISEDHKTMDELRSLFGDFVNAAGRSVLNSDDPEVRSIGRSLSAGRQTRFSLKDRSADIFVDRLEPAPDGIGFHLFAEGLPNGQPVGLQIPGVHNVANALAAIGAATSCGVPAAEAAGHLNGFAGLRRRLETVGGAGGVTVIDDFGHNPDKIAATLDTLHDFPGRLLILFQPHGFGPLRKMRRGFIDMFAGKLGTEDVLLMPEPVYFGGTVTRDISSRDIVLAVAAAGRQAEAHEHRSDCGDRLLELAEPGDRIVVMGARDDTLTEFAHGLLKRLER